MKDLDPNRRLHPDALLEHAPWLRRVALAIAGDPHLAEDLTQETWLAVMERGPVEDDPARTRSWLRTVVRRKASRQRQHHASSGRRERSAARPEALPSAAELAEQAEMQKRLLDAIGRLDERRQHVILLRYFRGMSAAEIARAEGVPAATVRSQLKRGIDQLREELASDPRDRRALLGFAMAGGVPPIAADAASASGAQASAPPESIASSLSSMLPIGAGVAILTTIVTFAVLLSSRGGREQEARPVDIHASGASTEIEPPSPSPAPDGSTEVALTEAQDDLAESEPREPAATQSATSDRPELIVRTVSPTGDPVEGIPVQLVLTPSGSNVRYPGPIATSDADGNASFGDVDADTYVVSIAASSEWYDVSNLPWILSDDPTVEFDGVADSSRTLVVRPTSTIVAKIVGPDGVLLEDAAIRVHYRSAQGNASVFVEPTRTDDGLAARGIGVFDGMATTLEVRHPGFHGALERDIDLVPGDVHDLGTLAFERQLTSLSGQISTRSGEPLAAAEVELEIDGHVEQTATDSEGRFAMHGLPSGSATLVLRDYELLEGPARFVLRDGDLLDAGRLVVADPSGTLTGTVRVEGGHAIYRTEVEFGPYTTKAEADGTFAIHGEPLAPTTLTARARVPALGSGYVAVRHDAVTFDDSPLDLVIRPQGLVLELRNLETGDPIDFEWVSLTGSRGIDLPADGRFGASFIASQDDVPGIVRFDDPPAGPWSISVSVRKYEPLEATFEVRDGLGEREQRVVLDMSPRTGGASR